MEQGNGIRIVATAVKIMFMTLIVIFTFLCSRNNQMVSYKLSKSTRQQDNKNKNINKVQDANKIQDRTETAEFSSVQF